MILWAKLRRPESAMPFKATSGLPKLFEMRSGDPTCRVRKCDPIGVLHDGTCAVSEQAGDSSRLTPQLDPSYGSRMNGLLIFAHRGASADSPENTMKAFRLAREQGADGIELDARPCATGELVVFHDDDLDRLAPGSFS